MALFSQQQHLTGMIEQYIADNYPIVEQWIGTIMVRTEFEHRTLSYHFVVSGVSDYEVVCTIRREQIALAVGDPIEVVRAALRNAVQLYINGCRDSNLSALNRNTVERTVDLVAVPMSAESRERKSPGRKIVFGKIENKTDKAQIPLRVSRAIKLLSKSKEDL